MGKGKNVEIKWGESILARAYTNEQAVHRKYRREEEYWFNFYLKAFAYLFFETGFFTKVKLIRPVTVVTALLYCALFAVMYYLKGYNPSPSDVYASIAYLYFILGSLGAAGVLHEYSHEDNTLFIKDNGVDEGRAIYFIVAIAVVGQFLFIWHMLGALNSMLDKVKQRYLESTTKIQVK